MFAEVYPLTRLPRRFAYFDYAIPEGMNVSTGDIVRVTLKHRPVLGVVRQVKLIADVKITSAILAIEARAFFCDADVRRIECIANAIYQSPSNVFSATLQGWKPLYAHLTLATPRPRKLSVKKSTAAELTRVLNAIKTHEHVAAQLSREGELALISILRKRMKGQILIICPREQDAEYVTETLSLEAASVLSGKKTSSERRAVIESWRSGKLATLVGTRQATLIPAKQISAVIILDSSSDDYAKLDRNPRFDARAAVKLLAGQHRAKLIMTGPTVRLEEFADPTFHSILTGIDLTILSHKARELYTAVPLVSEPLLDAITETLAAGKRTLLLYNKKGVAKRLQCGACGHIPLCGTCGAVPVVREDDLKCGVCETEMWMPVACPSCQSPKIRERSIGNKRLLTALQKAFPKASIALVDKEHTDRSGANIVIVTEYFFKNQAQPFRNGRFGVVADIAFDLALGGDDFRASEYALAKLYRLALFARDQGASCYVGAWLPEAVEAMLDGENWLQAESKLRKTYHLPPFSRLFTVVDKTHKILYKEPLEDFNKLPDSTIITADVSDYEHLPGCQKSE